jgi:hypothetical protein
MFGMLYGGVIPKRLPVLDTARLFTKVDGMRLLEIDRSAYGTVFIDMEAPFDPVVAARRIGLELDYEDLELRILAADMGAYRALYGQPAYSYEFFLKHSPLRSRPSSKITKSPT